MEMNYCVHPGELMKTILLSMGKTQKWLSEETQLNKTVISDLIHGKRNVTPRIADSFERATGFSAQALLAQQNEYDLFMMRKTKPIVVSHKQYKELGTPVEGTLEIRISRRTSFLFAI